MVTKIHLIISNHIKEYYYKHMMKLFKTRYIYIKSPNKLMFDFLMHISRTLSLISLSKIGKDTRNQKPEN